jgi:hypothetical protein
MTIIYPFGVGDHSMAVLTDIVRIGEVGDEYRRLMQISIDTSHFDDPALRDGNYAMRQAIRVHPWSTALVPASSKNFNDFILDGKVPAPDSTPPRHQLQDRGQPPLPPHA